MVSPPARQAAVRYLQQEKGYSQRRACALVGVPRSMLYYQPQRKPDEAVLRERIQRLARQHRRYGYRRITVLLRREGWVVNRKRVHRIWKAEGLSLPLKRRRRRREGQSLPVPEAAYPGHVWSYDILEDRTEGGGKLRFLNILDEYSRECLAIRVEKSITAERVIETLVPLFRERGAPTYLRSDNGPEFVAQAVREWLSNVNCQTWFIEPGSPWQNPYLESFNGKFRDECLNGELFRNGQEAGQISEAWRQEYNEYRPHSALDYLTPREYAQQWQEQQEKTQLTMLMNPSTLTS